MPLDPQISLAVKPPVLESPDFSKTFLTLGQLRYLNAETLRAQAGAQAAQEEAARKQDVYGQQATGYRLLGSLSRQPQAPAGGPPYDEATLGALPQGGSTPVPGSGSLVSGSQPGTRNQEPGTSGPAPGTVDLTDQAIQAQLYREVPNAAPELIKTLYEFKGKQLDQQKEALAQAQTKADMVVKFIGGATDQRSLDMGRAFVHQAGIPLDGIPPQYTPDLPKQFGELGRSWQQRIDQGNKEVDQRIAQQQADTAAFTAGSGRLTSETGAAAEERTGRETDYPVTPTGIVPVPKYPKAGAASGTPQPIPGTAPAMPGGAAEAAGYEQRALAAHKLAVQLEDQGVNAAGGWQKAASSVPLLGNYFTPEKLQQFNQAKSDFITAISRGESPRMSPQQLDLYDKQYFPQPGDFLATIRQKRASRESALQELRIQTNRPAGLTPPGQTQMPGTAPGAGSAPPASATPSAIQWTPEQKAELQQRFIWAGSTPADAARQVQAIVNATPPAAPGATEKPSATTKEVWSQKEFKAWLQKPALKGKFSAAVGLEFLRGKGIEVTP